MNIAIETLEAKKAELLRELFEVQRGLDALRRQDRFKGGLLRQSQREGARFLGTICAPKRN